MKRRSFFSKLLALPILAKLGIKAAANTQPIITSGYSELSPGKEITKCTYTFMSADSVWLKLEDSEWQEIK